MGEQHPISGRSARAALGVTIEMLDRQSKAIVGLAGTVKDQGELLDNLLDRGFFGRLKWLLTGR
jgi:hypothetical protein